MNTPKQTLGQAIDQVLNALSQLEKKEQQTVISTVSSFLELELSAPSKPGNNLPQGPASNAAPDTNGSNLPVVGLDIRTLKDQKQPDSARQMACLVAYYLLEHAPVEERKQTVNSSDIERFFKQAAYKLPTKLEQLLIDCKGAGYFEAVSRGEYKLTRVGYNLVTHSMPKGAKA